MADIKIAGIMRTGAYSPNHIGNDTAIFNAVVEQLRRRGCEVEVMSEAQFQEREIEQDVIINMCREPASVDKLQRLGEEGRIVVNSGIGIENCTRERMTRILLGHSIPYPDSLLVNTNEKISRKLKDQEIHACWIKRGDYHSMHKEDVTFCRHPEEAQDVLHEFFFRGIKRAVINRHLVGRHIKFYGVVGQPFFHWYYPFEQQAEAPAEEIGAEESTPSFDEKYLRDVCDNTARILDLVVYGGDCVLEPDGQVKIIDFNDWPSFAPCRKQAAVYIAKAVLALAGSKRNKKK